MQELFGIQACNGHLMSKLSLCYRTIVFIGSDKFVEGKHVKVTHKFVSEAVTTHVPRGCSGKIMQIDDKRDALVNFEGPANCQWVRASHFSSLTGDVVVGRTVTVASPFAVEFPGFEVQKKWCGRVVQRRDDGCILVKFPDRKLWVSAADLRCLELQDFELAMAKMFPRVPVSPVRMQQLRQLYGACATASPYVSKQRARGHNYAGQQTFPQASSPPTPQLLPASAMLVQFGCFYLEESASQQGVASQEAKYWPREDLPIKATRPIDGTWKYDLHRKLQSCHLCGVKSDAWKDKRLGFYKCDACRSSLTRSLRPLELPPAGSSERWPGGPAERYEAIGPLAMRWPEQPTEVRVVSKCCLRVALELRARRPCLLVMGRERGPAAGLAGHKHGQSNLVFRCTSLEQAATDERPTPVRGCYYVPGVRVLRNSDERRLDKPRRLDVVYSAVPQLKNKEDPAAVEEYCAEAREKIAAVLRICREKDHEELILGAWGSGWPNAPPARMAAIFKELLLGLGGEFHDVERRFRRVTFAILQDDSRRHCAFDDYTAAFQEPDLV